VSDDPILAAIEALGANLRGEIIKTRTDIMARIDTLQTSVDAIRDDLTVPGGGNDSVRRTNENTRDEVRDLARNVGDMQRILLKHGTRLDQLERRTP
jgi:hypothetical protein